MRILLRGEWHQCVSLSYNSFDRFLFFRHNSLNLCMNIESLTQSGKRLRTHTIRGAITLPEIKSFLVTLYTSKEFDHDFHSLWDMREAVFPEVTPDDIKELAYFVRVRWAEKHQRKTAVVISGDFHFGLSRMLEQFIGPSALGKFKTFRDPQQAVDWLEGKDTIAPHPKNG